MFKNKDLWLWIGGSSRCGGMQLYPAAIGPQGDPGAGALG
jgi:hypothetical protein